MESLLALFRVAAVKLTSKEESFVVGLFWWDENQGPFRLFPVTLPK
jgi:hypothetical protein